MTDDDILKQAAKNRTYVGPEDIYEFTGDELVAYARALLAEARDYLAASVTFPAPSANWGTITHITGVGPLKDVRCAWCRNTYQVVCGTSYSGICPDCERQGITPDRVVAERFLDSGKDAAG